MGFGIKELLVILVIVILLFGTRKLKGLGSDLGSAIKGFRQSINDNDDEDDKPQELASGQADETADTDDKKADETSRH